MRPEPVGRQNSVEEWRSAQGLAMSTVWDGKGATFERTDAHFVYTEKESNRWTYT